MILISPARHVDRATLAYEARGTVYRVFDQNADGELIPIYFIHDPFNDKRFTLVQSPFGTVYAEVVVCL